MAGFVGIAAAGKSIEMLLNSCFEELQPFDPPPPEPPGNKTKAVLVRTTDFESGNAANTISPPALSIFLYRVDLTK